MRKTIRIILILFSVVLILQAQATSQNRLILLVDKSGSLKTNDPQDLRKDALRFLIEQNNKIDQIAIYSFGSSVQTYYPDGKTIFYNVNKDKDKILRIIQSLEREDALTDLKQALSKIYDDLSRTNNWDNIRILIFTDAQLKYGDIPEGISLTDYLNGVYDIAKLFAAKNIPIDALAFTKNADISYLQTISSLTNGLARHSITPEKVYTTITEFDENRRGPFPPNKEIEIKVSSLVSSFRVQAFNKQLNSSLPTITLIDPSGKEDQDHTLLNYKASVTAEKVNPKQGTWKAIVKGADDVEVFYNKKIDYDLIVNKPMAKDLSLCQYSIVPFDIDIKSENIGKLVGAKCQIFLIDSLRNILQELTLDKNGAKFTGNMKINQPESIYTLIIKLFSEEDFIEKKYTIKIEECEKLNYTLNSDIVLENPIILSLQKPYSIKSNIEINLYNPSNEKQLIELFDDGKEKHGDGFANDNILSNKIDLSDDPGKYELEIKLNYEKDGIPVVNKNIEQLYKVVSLPSNIIEISYPADTLWNEKVELKIKNLTSFKIILKNLFIDTIYSDKLKMGLSDNNIILMPREEKIVSITVNSLMKMQGEHKLFNTLYCDLIYTQGEKYKIENAKINFIVELKSKLPFSFLVIEFLILLLLGIILIGLIGLFIVTPIRFKNVTFTTDDTPEIRIDIMKKNYLPYIDLENIGRIGISLFGLGYWYHRDLNNNIVKFYKNIQLSKNIY